MPKAKRLREPDLHHICESEPFCACVGHPNVWDECCCAASDDAVTSTYCIGCGHDMHAIDFNTGERIES